MPVTVMFRSALTSDHPFEELSRVAMRLVRQGQQRLQLVEELHRLSTALRFEGRGDAGALVLSVMDRVGGWCTPDMRI